MSEYAGRIAAGAIVAMTIALGLGFALSDFGTTATLSTSSFGSTITTASIQSDCAVAIYNQTDGSIYSLGRPCGAVAVPEKGFSSLNVTSSPALSIISTNGWINTFYVNLTTKQLTLVPGVTFSSNYEQAFYKGQQIINGTRLPTPYTSSTATINNIPTCMFLNGDVHVAYPPLQSGPIFLRIVTDKGGSLVTNGTVYASHRLSISNWQGSADYCLALSYDTNSTGFMDIADATVGMPGGMPAGGVYNYTLVAQYGANQSSRIVIPDIVVQPNMTTYLTVSVPSGQVSVTTVTCNQAGGGCTESTSTSTAKGG
jgi:hypothetical protein